MVGFANAISVAAELVRRDFLTQVRQQIENLGSMGKENGKVEG
jgi:hypothetical protein